MDFSQTKADDCSCCSDTVRYEFKFNISDKMIIKMPAERAGLEDARRGDDQEYADSMSMRVLSDVHS